MIRLVFSTALFFSACAPIPQEPRNLSDLKREVLEYSESEAYPQDLARSVAPAARWLRAREARPEEKTAVVFDIDETVLSNLPHMKKADWGYQPAEWDGWVATSRAPALEAVREIHSIAVEEGHAVFFLTGRKEKSRSATAKNLRNEGMGRYEALILRPDGPSEPAVDFKTRARREITGRGYTIIANLGDQNSDLEGGYAERTYKLPNPFYAIH